MDILEGLINELHNEFGAAVTHEDIKKTIYICSSESDLSESLYDDHEEVNEKFYYIFENCYESFQAAIEHKQKE